MTLTRRIIIAATLALLGLWGALHLASVHFLKGGFDVLEQRSMIRKVVRTKAALADSLETLQTQAADWACWDDTYQFLKDRGDEYRDSNLTDASFLTMRVDLLVLLDDAGRVVHARWRPEPASSPAMPSQDIFDALPMRTALHVADERPERTPKVVGLASVGGSPMLIAAYPVMTSEQTGPSHGSLYLGRWLKDEQVERLSRLSGTIVHVTPDTAPPADALPLTDFESPIEGVHSTNVSELQATALAPLIDVQGRRIGTLGLTVERDISQTGSAIIAYFETAVTIAGLVFTGALALWTHLRISRRITNLSDVVDDITDRADPELRVPAGGDDEITRLAGNINSLLTSRQVQEKNLARWAGDMQFARARAESATQAKTTFLANMSHEIRTPMTAILGYADLLLAEDGKVAPSVQQDALRTIQRNGEHLLNVVNDILDLSKIEAGRMTVERAACSPMTVLCEVHALMQLKAAAGGLTLTLDAKYPLPDAIVTDAQRFRQIVMNLVGNAVKFTPKAPEGAGRIAVTVETIEGKTRTLRVSVADSGPGISTELRARLFGQFAQGNDNAARRAGGSGLGLAISRQLAELMGGTLECACEPAPVLGGAVFCLTLPIPDSARMLLSAECEPIKPEPAPTNCAPKIRGRILLAEDGLDNQRLIRHVLLSAGASVEIAADGQEALEKAGHAHREGRGFDLIFMDIQMPRLDGYEATRALRLAEIDTPIVALTAHAMSGDKDKCLAAGCNDYLTKPIDRAKLLAACRRWIGEKAAETVDVKGG